MVRDSIYQRLGPHPGSQQPLSYPFLPLSLMRKSSPLKIRTEAQVKHVNRSISLNPGNASCSGYCWHPHYTGETREARRDAVKSPGGSGDRLEWLRLEPCSPLLPSSEAHLLHHLDSPLLLLGASWTPSPSTCVPPIPAGSLQSGTLSPGVLLRKPMEIMCCTYRVAHTFTPPRLPC